MATRDLLAAEEAAAAAAMAGAIIVRRAMTLKPRLLGVGRGGRRGGRALCTRGFRGNQDT